MGMMSGSFKDVLLYGLNVKANGTYDKATYKAVVKFQKKRHLTADGIIDYTLIKH